MTFWLAIVVVLSFGICSLGLQKGVERITKIMITGGMMKNLRVVSVVTSKTI